MAARVSAGSTSPMSADDSAPRSAVRAREIHSPIPWRLAAFLALAAIPSLWLGYFLLHEQWFPQGWRGDEPVDVSLEELGSFPFDATRGTQSDIPRRWRELDGKRVVLTGLLVSLELSESHIVRFQIGQMKKSSGYPPGVQERIFANVPDRPAPKIELDSWYTFTGVLHVKLVKDADEMTTSVYTMDVTTID